MRADYPLWYAGTDLCSAPLSGGSGGGATWTEHLSDFPGKITSRRATESAFLRNPNGVVSIVVDNKVQRRIGTFNARDLLSEAASG